MRFAGYFFAAICVSGVAAAAESDSIQRGPVPQWVVQSDLLPVPNDAAGMMFVRGQDTLVHLDEDGQRVFVGYRIRILHPNALALGNLSIAWNPSAGAPTVHAVTIYRGDQAIDVLANTAFEILRREGQLEAAMLDGTLTAVLKVPDLRVGDELAVAFTTRSKDPTLGNDSFGILALQPEPAPGRFRVGLSWEPGNEPKVKTTTDLTPLARRGATSLDFTLDNPASISPPKDAPPRYAWQRTIEYTDFGGWSDISRRFHSLFANAAQLTAASALKKEAAAIAAANPTQLGRASAALKLVQQDVRYIYVGLDGGNFTPAAADETWQRRYGDCKGKSALLLALLGELGVDAEAVLASNTGIDDGLDGRLPNPAMFDHVLVRAKIDGKVYWLDGTLPAAATPSLQPIVPYRWVLPLSDAGAEIEQVPWHPDTHPSDLSLYDIDASGGFDQPASVTTTTVARGLKGLQQQFQFSSVSHDQLVSAFRRELVGETWQTIEDVTYRYDAPSRASVVKITGTWNLEWDDDGDGKRSVALPGGGFSPPERRVRAAQEERDVPFYKSPEYDCQVTTIRLPSTTDPANWTFNSSYDSDYFGGRYHRAFEKRNDTIRMVRGFRVQQPEISAAAAKADNSRVSEFDNSKAWIYFDPNDTDNSVPDGVRVPAVQEIDWTAEDGACLPGEF